MEMAIPIVGLSLIYIINNQLKQKDTFTTSNALPNVDIPNRNYPDEFPVVSFETDQTSNLSTVNKINIEGGVYTDKYFNQNIKSESTNPSGQYYSLTGQKVDSSYFEHNNMVPFFGSNARNIHSLSNSAESVLDNMTGSGSQIITKKEQSPLFSPHDTLQYAHGAPNNSDFYQSRVNVGMRMANVKPFEEIKVAPGLGLGYTSQGSGGFNSGTSMREQWLDKGVDELRVANKQKASGNMALGYEGHATSHIKNMGAIGNMEKNRPERAFDTGPERLFTTTGLEKGAMMHSIPIDRYVSRPETTTDYTGIAGTYNDATYVKGEYKPSKNIELGQVPLNVVNAGNRGYANDSDYGIKSKKAYPNNRSVNHQDNYFGMVGGSIGTVVAPLLDALRPSRRENTIGNLRPYQNAKSNVGQSYLFNPNDRPNTTIRETTENSKFNLNVNASQIGAYANTPQQPIHNQRDYTTDYFYAGNSGAGDRTRQPRTYNAEYNQRNNDNKSSTNVGYTPKGNMSLLNSTINMSSVAKDAYLKNSRPLNPSMPYQIPDTMNIGELQGNANGLYQGIQVDRNKPEILSSLKNNPYAINTASQL